ncbi:MAG: Aldose 1-epimerase [Bacteroidetes bacterium]|jgi:galactose mutarotase-like enzyme|nr:Aldose 1-epimerase [Bacteroidota bacterium]
MTEKIGNDLLNIEVSVSGAELSSIYHIPSKKQYLWQGGEKWWPRRAPVLFPVVGKLKDNTFQVNGEKYNLGQHGFARDKDFSLIERNNNKLVFSLSSDESTLKVYPFHFELLIIYEIRSNCLQITYQVKNKDQKEIFFSIGAHPGFNCPVNKDELFSDYYLEFEETESLDRHLLEGGLFTGLTEPVMIDSNRIDLSYELFAKDAIVFKNMKSTSIYLKSKKNKHSLKFNFSDFPYFGIWTKPGAPFICLEPWCGIADNQYFEGELKDKEGIIGLDTGSSFLRSYLVEVNS